MSLFHAVVLERRRYGSIGYNEIYKFNESDLDAALGSLKNLIEKFSYVPWNALRYIMGKINYGGRVTDEWDSRLMSSLLMKFCQPDVLNDDFSWTSNKCNTSVPVGTLQHYQEQILKLPD